MTSLVKVNQFTHDPGLAWLKMKDSIKKVDINVMPLDTPIFPNKVTIYSIKISVDLRIMII